jgi:predicted RNA-binding protein YlqC (UPF0109 family)
MKTKNSKARLKRNPGVGSNRIVRHPDSVMLDWVALYVTGINSLDENKGSETIELLASNEDNCIVITRRGKTAIEAFRKCVKDGMTEMPNDKAKTPEPR